MSVDDQESPVRVMYLLIFTRNQQGNTWPQFSGGRLFHECGICQKVRIDWIFPSVRCASGMDMVLRTNRGQINNTSGLKLTPRGQGLVNIPN